MQIRPATLDDVSALVDFNQLMARETEGKTLNPDTLSAGVRQLVDTPAFGFYLVAEQDDQIVGSLMVTYEWSDWRNGLFWWIQSVYVKPENRRQGIYSGLYHEVQRLGEQAGNVCGYRLYVEKENTQAQATYEHLGMVESHYLMYESQ
ncbi:GNAT family N-acetyltransferase [Saliniradius amylolyticus]|uniref:GNAT family N-acetyltransferase n=1 Tax=Saliniradius amylolyticus TaxID=2183582 RepID=UPI003B8338E1